MSEFGRKAAEILRKEQCESTAAENGLGRDKAKEINVSGFLFRIHFVFLYNSYCGRKSADFGRITLISIFGWPVCVSLSLSFSLPECARFGLGFWIQTRFNALRILSYNTISNKWYGLVAS